jgi:hypothetical protein
MNIAIYNPTRGHQLLGKQACPGITREDVRDMALGMQIDAMHEGVDLGSMLLVAWQNQPTQFLSIFTLGDEISLDQDLLDGIQSLVHTRH